MIPGNGVQKKNPIRKEQVLSLDMATHFGFYNPIIGWGTLDTTETRKNDYKQHKQVHDQLVEWITSCDIRQVVAEDFTVFAAGNIVSIKKLCEYRGILLYVCDELNLPEPVFINCSEAKRWLTGNGHADKQMMVSMVKKRFGIDTKGDDNAADAITFWYMYVKRFKLL